MKKLWLALLLLFMWTTPLYAQLSQTPNLGLNIIPFGYPRYDIPSNENTTILDTAVPTLNLSCNDNQVPVWTGGKFSICGVSLTAPARVIVANKPASPILNQVVVVIDAADGTTCTSAGGSSTNICQWTGSTWVVIGGGSGGGGGQPLDADLTALAVNTTAGFWVAATNVVRSMATANANNITIINPAGVAGNPTWDVGPNVALTTRGFAPGFFDYDFNSAASLTVPRQTGAAPIVAGRIAYNNSNNQLVFGNGTTTVTIANTTNTQALNANLTAFSNLTGVNGKIPYFTAAGAMALTSGLETPCADTGGQHLNLSSIGTFVCGTSSTGGLSGLTTGAFTKALTATTIGTSTVLTESAGNINIAGGLEVNCSGATCLDFNTSAYTGHLPYTGGIVFPYVGASASVAMTTGALTNGDIVKVGASGQLVSGGAGGTGTWTDASNNTSSGNKTIKDTAAGGTNTLTIGIAPYWDAASLTIPAASTCTAAALTLINSGPSAYTITCTDAATSSFEGNLMLRQDVATVNFTLTVNDVDSASQHFAGDFSAMCRNTGTTVNNTWGTGQSVDITMTTASNNYTGTTATVTPNGTCTSGATLFWRFIVNTTPFTDGGNARVIGVLMKQVS